MLASPPGRRVDSPVRYGAHCDLAAGYRVRGVRQGSSRGIPAGCRWREKALASKPFEPGEATRGQVGYVFSRELVLAVNAALAADRPLLVRGPPGSGKSTLGRAVAVELGWRYYRFGFGSETRLKDLCYRWDEVRRLRDAQVAQGQLWGPHEYVEPGVLWWTFDADSAARRGAPAGQVSAPAADPGSPGASREPGAVLALDEIDRVDPALCRDLFDLVSAASFEVPELGLRVAARDRPLVILTSAEERALPPAVRRACVAVELAFPCIDDLVAIGQLHFPDAPVDQVAAIASRVQALRMERIEADAPPLTTADYLDVLRAVRGLGIEADEDRFGAVEEALLGSRKPAIARPLASATPSADPQGCIFICYSRDDESFVLELAKALVRRGVRGLWLDQWSIPGGADWNAAIDEAIYGCARFLIVLSASAVAKIEVQSELRLALNERKPIVPVILEPCRVPRQLNVIQQIFVKERPPDDPAMLEQIVRAIAPD